MHTRSRNVRTGLVAAGVALLLLIGAGVAYATGSDSPQQSAGPNMEKAKSIALDHTNDGSVTGTELDDEEGYYEVEVTKDDGSQVDVHLDRNFNVLGTPADHEGSDHESSDDNYAHEEGGE
jgi:hypothetical protein